MELTRGKLSQLESKFARQTQQHLDSIKHLKIELQQKDLMLEALQSSSRRNEEEGLKDLNLYDSLELGSRVDHKATQTDRQSVLSKHAQTLESITRPHKPALRVESLKQLQIAGKHKTPRHATGTQTEVETPSEFSAALQLFDIDSTLPIKATAKSLENRIAEVMSQSQRLNSLTQETSTKMSTLESALLSHKDDRITWEGERRSLTDQIRALNRTVKSLEDEREVLEKRIEGLDSAPKEQEISLKLLQHMSATNKQYEDCKYEVLVEKSILEAVADGVSDPQFSEQVYKVRKMLCSAREDYLDTGEHQASMKIARAGLAEVTRLTAELGRRKLGKALATLPSKRAEKTTSRLTHVTEEDPEPTATQASFYRARKSPTLSEVPKLRLHTGRESDDD